MQRDSDFLPARGLQFARSAMAKAAGRNIDERIGYATKHWGPRSAVVQMLKADVSGHEAADSTANVAGTSEQAAEFGELVDSGGLLRSRLTPVPANVPFLAAVTPPSSSFIGQSKGVPVSRAALDRSTMQARKVGSLIVITQEWLDASDARAELLVLNMMLRSARLTIDAALADPSNAGDAATPASITAGATPINSTGDIADDAQAAIAAYSGSLETAVWWMRPDLAAQASLRAPQGAGAGLGAKGGVLAGLPCYVSEGIPIDSSGSPLILVDSASVALVDEGYSVMRSQHGTVEMSTAPTGATDTPVTAGTGTKMVSLWQEGAVGLLLIRRANWKLANPGAAVIIQDCNYGAP